MSSEQLLIVPRDAALPYYLSWFTERQLPAPALSSLGIFVASRALGPIAGVGVYVTDGPYFFLENLATAPSLPKKLRHRAILALAEQARILGAILNKHPLLSANSTGLVRTLVRGGFNISRSVPMWGVPVVELRGLNRENAAGQTKPVVKRRAKASKAGGAGASIQMVEANDAWLLASPSSESNSPLAQDGENGLNVDRAVRADGQRAKPKPAKRAARKNLPRVEPTVAGPDDSPRPSGKLRRRALLLRDEP